MVFKRHVADLGTIIADKGNPQKRNKTELFSFLADQAILKRWNKLHVFHLKVLWNDTISLCQCTHEEGDTRVLLHALDASAE